MAHNAEESGPNPIDMHVGARIRMRRKFLGHSQSQLADALGLTFQQVQKYERGTNRVSASKLFEIGRFLEAPVSYFFEGLDYSEAQTGFDGEGSRERFVHGFLMTPEGIELASIFPKIGNARLRRKLLEIVRELAGVDEEEAQAEVAPKKRKAA
jgi:transcriptional regulator with XRE-family HTH domain